MPAFIFSSSDGDEFGELPLREGVILDKQAISRLRECGCQESDAALIERARNLVEAAAVGTGARFKALKNKLSGQKSVSNPAGLAAHIGRKKYGNSEFAKLSAKGRRRKAKEANTVGTMAPYSASATRLRSAMKKAKKRMMKEAVAGPHKIKPKDIKRGTTRPIGASPSFSKVKSTSGGYKKEPVSMGRSGGIGKMN